MIKITQLAGCQVKSKPLSAAQIRAARALIRWSAEDLARNSSLGVATIRRAEIAENETSMTAANDAAVRRAFESEGIEFIDENGGGVGVRLRKRGAPRSRKSKPVSPSSN
jgi:transcriptional regulator with XRE-family HTH domain